MAATRELYRTLQKAVTKLDEAQKFPDTEPMRESTIQRFEYTFELSWKVMSSILKDQGNEVFGVKNIIRDAARLGLIDNPGRLIAFANARNLASHIYKEAIAKQVYEVARGDFLECVQKLIAV